MATRIDPFDSQHLEAAYRLLIGLVGAVRNPLAHEPKMNWPMPELDALDILTLVPLIHRKLDGAIRVGAVSP